MDVDEECEVTSSIGYFTSTNYLPFNSSGETTRRTGTEWFEPVISTPRFFGHTSSFLVLRLVLIVVRSTPLNHQSDEVEEGLERRDSVPPIRRSTDEERD